MLRWSKYLALEGEGCDANNVRVPQLIAVRNSHRVLLNRILLLVRSSVEDQRLLRAL